MKKTIIKCAAFVLLLGLAVYGIYRTLGLSDHRMYQTWSGFYKEADDSLDAVYIGASNVYPFWSPTVAWNEYGFAVYPLGIAAMPAEAVKYAVEEAQKTQPDALFIINLNTFKDAGTNDVNQIHYVCDSMKFSSTKVNAINALYNTLGDEADGKLEYYLPFIRFHSRWSNLTEDDFIYANNGLKGSSDYNSYWYKITDVSDSYTVTDQYIPLTDAQNDVLTDLMDYCEDQNLNVLFVIVPQAINDESSVGQLNTMADMAAERGFNVYNMYDELDTIGLQLSYDFYNEKHLNVHGSLKQTYYFSEYLKENYDFADKRGESSYESWDEAYSAYLDLISRYALDFEIAGAARDYSTDIPTLSASASGSGIKISWTAVDNADQYLIYRKTDGSTWEEDSAWECIAAADSEATSYKDKDVEKYIEYTYTVVPVSGDGTDAAYGNFDYTGVTTSPVLDTPELVALESSGSDVTITWKAIEDASGYFVYRKIIGQESILIGTVSAEENVTAYTDDLYQDNIPYLYFVRSYETVNGEDIKGTYDHNGLLFENGGIAMPELSVRLLDDGSRALSWGSAKGAAYYNVYRMSSDGSWELIAEKLGVDAAAYTDSDDISGYDTAVYKITGAFDYRGEVYEYDSASAEVSLKGGN